MSGEGGGISIFKGTEILLLKESHKIKIKIKKTVYSYVGI